MLVELLGMTSLQACMVGLVAGLLVYWMIQKRRYNMPPGPTALPLLGNALQMNNKFLHVKIAQEWAKTYGPVVCVRFGPMPVVFVNNIECVMEMLVKKSTDFAGRMQVPSMNHLTYGGKSIAFGDYGPVWKLQRKISSKALRHYMQGNALEKRVHEAVGVGLLEMEKETATFDPKEYINFIIGNLLTGLLFGGSYDYNNKEVHTLIEKEDELIDALAYGVLEDFVPGLRYVYKSAAFKSIEEMTKVIIDDFVTRKFREEEKSFERENIRHFTDTSLLAHLKAQNGCNDPALRALTGMHLKQTVADISLNIRHFTDTLILARLEAQEEGGDPALQTLTDMHLIQTAADIFFAGIDTSRLTLRFAILHMMAFQDIQTKVQEEIDRVVGHERLPSMADRPDLPYTEAVLHESMRLSSVVPIGIMHMTTCDTELAGYRLPKGTQVIVNHWALHHDPDAWEDPERFIPERFLDENGKLGPKPANWLPFSAGKRVCLGEFVAKPELHLIFASLMQRFTWRPKSGTVPDLSPDGSMLTILPKETKVDIVKRK